MFILCVIFFWVGYYYRRFTSKAEKAYYLELQCKEYEQRRFVNED